MNKGKFNQGKCEICDSWHFAINLDDKGNIIEMKCCRCERIETFEPKLNVFLDRKDLKAEGKLA